MDLAITDIVPLVEPGGSAVVVASTCGPLRSDDAGLTWHPLDAWERGPAFAIGAHALEDGGILLIAGTLEGVVRSTDNGRSWEMVLSSSPVTAVAIREGRTGQPIVLVGTEADGILRSTDVGAHWAEANPGLLDYEVLSLAVSSGGTVFAGTASGLYRSRNAGQAWRPLILPALEGPVSCIAVQVYASSRRQVWAGTESAGLLWSDDGTTWHAVSGIDSRNIASLAISRLDPSRVYVATDVALFRTHDAGVSWECVGSPEAVLCLESIAGPEGEVLLAGTSDCGILRSTDEGTSWSATDVLE